MKAGTHIGPVVDQSQLNQDTDYIAIGQQEGAKLAFGGELLKRDTPGFYLQPALFTEATNAMRINREEIFGPVASVIRVRDYDEALTVANDTPFGLSSGIATTSLKHATHFKRNAEAGMVMGQSADGRRRFPRAVRRPQGFVPRLARAGPLRRRVPHNSQDGLHLGLSGNV